jgi:hypothetical protein
MSRGDTSGGVMAATATATATGRNAPSAKRKSADSSDDSSQRRVRQRNDDDDNVVVELNEQMLRFKAPSFTNMIGGDDMLAVMRSYLTQREDALLRTVSDEFSDGYVYQASSVTLNMSGASRVLDYRYPRLRGLDTLKVLTHRYPRLRGLHIEQLQQKDEDAVFAVLLTISKRMKQPLQTLEVTNCNTGNTHRHAQPLVVVLASAAVVLDRV